MKSFVSAALGAAFLLLCAGGAAAGQEAAPLRCAPRGEIARALAAGYGEHLLVEAPMDDGRLLEIYVADDRRSWTAVAVVPLLGVGCPIASGTDFETRTGGREG